MKLVVAGTGYVGLVTAVCMAEKGHEVICVDKDDEKIKKLNGGISPIFEKDLDKLMNKNAKRILYTSDYRKAYANAEIIFIGVGTPEKRDGSANLCYIYQVVDEISSSLENDCIVVIKSTVPIGTNEKIEKFINEHKKQDIKISVVSNPEFLAQGTAVHDTLVASRIVIGSNNEVAKEKMLELYESFDAPVLATDRRSAEMIKYASNDFLALKISYINEIANLCEEIGANIEDVSRGMGYDPRIGDKFLKAGIGYGGSCFPKDTKALHWLSNFHDHELKTIKAAIEVNEQQKLRLIKKARKYYDSFEGLTVAVLGLTFKPGTDDLREAPSLVNIPILLDDGAKVKAWDPVGIPNFKEIYPNEIEYCRTIDETIENADICFIFTEWNEIKGYDVKQFEKLMRKPIVLDGRNCIIVDEKNIVYEKIGVKNTY